MDDDDNIDLSRGSKQQHPPTAASSAVFEYSAGNTGGHRQKHIISSQIENLEYGGDEHLKDISSTKNEFHKFSKGADWAKNEFTEDYKDESLDFIQKI